MASEAVIINLLGNAGDPVEYTVASGTGIEKGTLLKLSDPRTAAATSGFGDIFCGIAAAEKKSDDYATTLAVYTNGIFDLTVAPGASCSAGELVTTSGANLISGAAAASMISGGKIVGKALEYGSTGEVIAVKIGNWT